jgi:hypothetical protein
VGDIKYEDEAREVKGDPQEIQVADKKKTGEYYDIPFEIQRDSWRKLLKKIRKWEKLQAEDGGQYLMKM